MGAKEIIKEDKTLAVQYDDGSVDDYSLRKGGYSRSQIGMIGRARTSGTSDQMVKKINYYRTRINDTPGYRAVKKNRGQSQRKGQTRRKFNSRAFLPTRLRDIRPRLSGLI